MTATIYLHEFSNFFVSILKDYQEKYLTYFQNNKPFQFLNEVRPLIFHMIGDKGIGKTTHIQEIAKANHWGLISREINKMPLDALIGLSSIQDIDLNNLGFKYKYFKPNIQHIKITIWSVGKLYLEILKKCCQNILNIFIIKNYIPGDNNLDYFVNTIINEHKISDYILPPNLILLFISEHNILNIDNERFYNIHVKPNYFYWKDQLKIHPIVKIFLNKNYKKYFVNPEMNLSPKKYKQISDTLYNLKILEHIGTNTHIFNTIINGIVGSEIGKIFRKIFYIYQKIPIHFHMPIEKIYQFLEKYQDNENLIYITGVKLIFEAYQNQIEKIINIINYIYKNISIDIGLSLFEELFLTYQKDNHYHILENLINKINNEHLNSLLQKYINKI